MDQAVEQGIIFIDGSGPTYATATVRSLLKKSLFAYIMLFKFAFIFFNPHRSLSIATHRCCSFLIMKFVTFRS